MRVLFISTSSGSKGGGELFLLYLGKELINKGHEVLLWCSNHERMDGLAKDFSSFGEVIRTNYINTYDFKLRSLRYVLPIFKSYHKEWNSLNPDVIHLNKQNLEDGLDLLYSLSQIEIPSLCTIHITQSAKTINAKWGVLRDKVSRYFLSQYKGKLVSVSKSRNDSLVKFLRISKIDKLTRLIRINNGVSIPEREEINERRKVLRDKLNLKDEDIMVLSVARLNPQKNPFLALNWFQSLLSFFPEAKYVWVGDGDLINDWNKEIQLRKLNDFVITTGWQKSTFDYYAGADIFFHSASFEGMPFSILEAMSFQLPVFITNTLSEDLQLPQNTHFSIEGSSSLPKFSFDELKTRAYNGRTFIKDHFSLNSMAKEYLKAYDSIIPRNV